MEENADYTMAELQRQPALGDYRSAAETPLQAVACSRDYSPCSRRDREPKAMQTLQGEGELCEGISTEVYCRSAAEIPLGAPAPSREYHPDYLGNVELITDNNGEVYEFFFYNPWGESLYEWQSGTGTFTSPYRFNAKELDPETGLHYYGARYYANRTGIWLSVDPLTAKYPSMSPYVFTGNNPAMLVDPDGRVITPVNSGAYRLFEQTIASFFNGSVTQALEFFDIKVRNNRTSGKKTNVYTGVMFSDKDAFKRAARRAGIDKADIEAAWDVYLALSTNESIEIEATTTEGESFSFDLGNGTDPTTLGQDEVFESSKTENSGLNAIGRDLENSLLTDKMNEDLYTNNSYGADKKGEGWLLFENKNYYGNSPNTKGIILIDVSPSRTNEDKINSLLEALSKSLEE